MILPLKFLIYFSFDPIECRKGALIAPISYILNSTSFPQTEEMTFDLKAFMLKFILISL